MNGSSNAFEDEEGKFRRFWENWPEYDGPASSEGSSGSNLGSISELLGDGAVTPGSTREQKQQHSLLRVQPYPPYPPYPRTITNGQRLLEELIARSQADQQQAVAAERPSPKGRVRPNRDAETAPAEHTEEPEDGRSKPHPHTNPAEQQSSGKTAEKSQADQQQAVAAERPSPTGHVRPSRDAETAPAEHTEKPEDGRSKPRWRGDKGTAAEKSPTDQRRAGYQQRQTRPKAGGLAWPSAHWLAGRWQQAKLRITDDDPEISEIDNWPRAREGCGKTHGCGRCCCLPWCKGIRLHDCAVFRLYVADRIQGLLQIMSRARLKGTSRPVAASAFLWAQELAIRRHRQGQGQLYVT